MSLGNSLFQARKKCGLSQEEVDLLENYVLKWDIRGSRWTQGKDWTWHPKGYGMKWTEEDRTLLALVDEMEKTAADPQNQTVFISHGDCLADAELVSEEVRRRFGTKDIHINYVGPVIGSHSGPGTVALFFLGSPR